jgi:methionyl aminopeptidase
VIQFRSDREISEMRKAGLLVWQAHQLAGEQIRPGATSAQVAEVVSEFFKKHNAVPLFLNYPNSQKGKRPFPAVACISFNDEIVHGIPSQRILKEGDILSIDLGAKVNGWCGDAAVTHAVGQVTPEIQRLLDVTKGVLHLAIRRMGERSWWSEVAAEMQAYVAKAGFSTVEDMVGHGVGREMHEDPQVPHYLSKQVKSRRGNFPLKPGLVIAVEPMVNIGTKNVKLLADDWTLVTKDRKPSAHFEHTVAVTKGGVKVLTAPPRSDEPEWVEWGAKRLRPPDSFPNPVLW